MFEQLKKPVIFYAVSGVLLPIVIFLNLAIDKYNNSLQEMSEKLIRVKSNISSMEAATREIGKLLIRTKNYLPSDFYENSTEEKIFSTFDDLKTSLKPAEVSASVITGKAGIVSLPVKITAPLNNYSDIVNKTGYLRSLKFPFFRIKNISLIRQQNKDGVSVTYLIDGELHMPKNGAISVQ